VKHIRSSVAIAVASGVAVASLALPSAAAAKPASTKDPAAAAAGYLASKLAGKHHDHLTVKVGKTTYADDGETADAVLSMDAAGAAQAAAKRATKWLEKDATNYTGATPDIYPGSAAKLLLVAEAQHVNPEKFGSLDLIGAIVGDEGAGGAPSGEYQNPSDTTYGASVLNQSLAVLALANTVDTAGQPSSNAVSFLAGQQCQNGAFQVAIRSNTSTDCAAGDDDVDTTSYAIQALVAAGHRDAAASALTWLRKAENGNGGWGETNGAKSEANSTSIAVEALIAGHRENSKGLKWLAHHAVGCGQPSARRGAVRYQGKFDPATALRATSQAGVALAGRSLAGVDRNGASAAAPALSCPAHHRKKK
jgi:hypothetical protein